MNAWKSLIRNYEQLVTITDDFLLAAKFCYAIHATAGWEGDPVWGFLVGPSSSGKTLVLQSMAKADGVVYQSQVKPANLVSGWRNGEVDGDEDPSLIPKFIEAGCAVFKDWTEVLSQNYNTRRETLGVMQGAYDGSLDRTYGNMQKRHYEGRFNLAAGVTGAIYQYDTAETTMGYRFVKLHISVPEKELRHDMAVSSILSLGSGIEIENELSIRAKKFLDKLRDDAKKVSIGLDQACKVATLAELACQLRAHVPWKGHGLNADMHSRPEVDGIMRMSKQLGKIARGVSAVLGKDEMDDEVFETVRRVSFDTIHGIRSEILEYMMDLGGELVTVDDLIRDLGLNYTTVKRRIDDLKMIGLVTSRRVKIRKGPGAPRELLGVRADVRELWSQTTK